MKRRLLFSLLIFVLSLPGPGAIDYGAILQVEFDAAGHDETDISGTVILAPWLSVPFGTSELYVSAGLYSGIADESYLAPELYRLEFSSRFSSLLSIRVGRINWEDSSGLVAKGNFDGVDVLFDLGQFRLGVNALYTGLLFKDTAKINTSPANTKDYSVVFDWSDFAGTYFAPARLLASVYGTFPGFPAGRGTLYAGLMGQFDFSDTDEAFNTQYLLLHYTLFFNAFNNAFDVDAAAAIELENTDADGFRPAIAFSLEGGWQLPTALADRLSLGIAWASGDGSATGAFFPITREAQSFVLAPTLSGILVIRVNYHARIIQSLSTELGCAYFIRTDSTSFQASYLEDNSYALGAELNARLLWVPFSDLAITLNGGVFLPQTGSAWVDDAPTLWRITLGTVFSF